MSSSTSKSKKMNLKMRLLRVFEPDRVFLVEHGSFVSVLKKSNQKNELAVMQRLSQLGQHPNIVELQAGFPSTRPTTPTTSLYSDSVYRRRRRSAASVTGASPGLKMNYLQEEEEEEDQENQNQKQQEDCIYKMNKQMKHYSNYNYFLFLKYERNGDLQSMLLKRRNI